MLSEASWPGARAWPPAGSRPGAGAEGGLPAGLATSYSTVSSSLSHEPTCGVSPDGDFCAGRSAQHSIEPTVCPAIELGAPVVAKPIHGQHGLVRSAPAQVRREHAVRRRDRVDQAGVEQDRAMRGGGEIHGVIVGHAAVGRPDKKRRRTCDVHAIARRQGRVRLLIARHGVTVQSRHPPQMRPVGRVRDRRDRGGDARVEAGKHDREPPALAPAHDHDPLRIHVRAQNEIIQALPGAEVDVVEIVFLVRLENLSIIIARQLLVLGQIHVLAVDLHVQRR